MSPEIFINLAAGLSGSLLTATGIGGIAYGVIKQQVRKHEMAMDELEEKYVTYRHFDAMFKELRQSVNDTQHDIKKILIILREMR